MKDSEIAAQGIPVVRNFREFLEKHAVAKGPNGYAPFSFKGREGLAVAVDIIDYVLGNPMDVSAELPHLPGVSVEDLRRERKPIKDARRHLQRRIARRSWARFKVYLLRSAPRGLYLPTTISSGRGGSSARGDRPGRGSRG
jgi:hypothetical protein